MKRTLIIFLGTLLSPIIAWAGQDFGTVFDAAVYQSPNADSNLIMTLPVGSDINVTALDRNNYWAKVSLSDGQTGYVDLGCLDFPGGKTVTVTDTFDANNVASKGIKRTNAIKTVISFVFFLLMTAGLGHMLYIRVNEDNEPRIFVGSTERLALFSALMACGVFMVNGL